MDEIAALKEAEAERDAWADDLVADAEAILNAARRRAEEMIPASGDVTQRQADVMALAGSLAMLASQRAIGQDVAEALASVGDEVVGPSCCDSLVVDGEVRHEATCENYNESGFTDEDDEEDLPAVGSDPTAP